MKRADVILGEYYVSCLTAKIIRGELSREGAQQIGTLIKFGVDSDQVIRLLISCELMPPICLN